MDLNDILISISFIITLVYCWYNINYVIKIKKYNILKIFCNYYFIIFLLIFSLIIINDLTELYYRLLLETNDAIQDFEDCKTITRTNTEILNKCKTVKEFLKTTILQKILLNYNLYRLYDLNPINSNINKFNFMIFLFIFYYKLQSIYMYFLNLIYYYRNQHANK